MAEEMANSKPAAVDKAAARPPAAIRPITQGGRLAISGLANTMMSLFTSSSLPAQPALLNLPSSSAACATFASSTAVVAAATSPPSFSAAARAICAAPSPLSLYI